MRKAAAALVVLGAVFLVFGCGEPAEKLNPGELGKRSLEGANPAPVIKGEVVDGGTLVWRLEAQPGTLNPLTSRDYYASQTLGLMNDSLAERDLDTLEWKPLIAKSWDISDDHLTYTFHLRDDVKWHDGVPLTSADIVYSWKTMMDPKVFAPQLRNYYKDLDRAEALDDYTVRFIWKEPYFRSFTFSSGFPILPKHIFDTGEEFNSHPAGRHPVGNGMYKFVEWKTDQKIVLERNEDYFGVKPNIKRIILSFIPDANSALLLAGRGEVDSLIVNPEQWVRELAKPVYSDKHNRFHKDQPVYSFMGWNRKRPFFADARVRKAMTMLVDREQVRKHVLYGLATTVTGNFYIKAPAYDHSIKQLPYDPKTAAGLLDEAGWIDHDDDGIRDKTIDGKKVDFSFFFTYSTRPNLFEMVGTLLQEELRKLGVRMELKHLEWATFSQRMTEGDFDAVGLRWVTGLESDPYQIWHSSQIDGGSNFISFVNEEADRIIEEARREFDDDKRRQLYHRFHAILHEDQPYTFLFCELELSILNKRFHNTLIYEYGMDLRDWYVPAGLQKPR